MRSKTGWESFIGIFSKARSDSIRQERMRAASIDDKLQDLISKSDVIVNLLEGQLTMLEEQTAQLALLGEQASDPRCAPDHRNTTLKVHVGPVSSHVANWEAVEETLRGTRYEHFLSE